MTVFISNKEMTEIAESVIKLYHKDANLCRVDIDGVATKFLGLTVLYESIRENDKDKIGFLSDGIRPLKIRWADRDEEVIFAKDTIVLDNYLRQPNEEHHRRFVLAHEVAHVLCGRIDPNLNVACFNQVYDSEQNYSLAKLKERMSFHEMQASSMAGTLLMPKFVLMNAMRKFGISKPMPVYGSQSFLPQDKLKLQKIADTLAVSHTALLIQLKKAKLLDLRPMSEYVELLRNPNPEVCQ